MCSSETVNNSNFENNNNSMERNILDRKFIRFPSSTFESTLFLPSSLLEQTLEHRLNVEIRAVITHRGTPCIFSGRSACRQRSNPAPVTPLPPPQGRCPTRGSSDTDKPCSSFFISSQRPRGGCEETTSPPVRLNRTFPREFYLALPPFNLINRGGSRSPLSRH